MARIRSIRPEFCTSLAIADLELVTQLHFVRLWTHCDDAGRAVDDPRLIKGACWPLEEQIGADDIEAMQAELAKTGRIVRYEVDGRSYFEVVNWEEHQRPNRPVPSKLPAPTDTAATSENEDTGSQHEQLTAPTVSEHEALTPVVVDGEVDGDGVGEGEEPSPAPPDEVRLVFDTWIDVTERTGRTVLDAKRRRCIERAIKSHGLDTTLEAVRGWANSPFHRGENAQGTVYDDLTLILRDTSKIEGFARLHREPPRAQGSRRQTSIRQGIDAVREWAAEPEHIELEAANG